MNVPHTIPASWDELNAGRFAHSIRHDSPHGCAIGLLGIPDDLGVRLNGGRAGAHAGPQAFRRALARLGAAEPSGFKWPKVFDAGNVTPGATLTETHERAGDAVGALLDAGLLPIAIGGGHDLTLPTIEAIARHFGPVTTLYFDAHLDVRENEGSGMAFRRLAEIGATQALELHGFRPFVNAREHVNWFLANGGTLHPDNAAIHLPEAERIAVSFDLDVLDAAYAPGVSATNPCGWTPREAEAWVHACGADRRVRCFDLMELCPAHDEGERTARLCAHLFLTFLAGFTRR